MRLTMQWQAQHVRGASQVFGEREVEAPDVDVLVVEEEESEEHLDSPWRVILYNDDIHSFDEVILQLVKATGCSLQDAERYALKAHFLGKAAVFEGTFEKCFRVQSVLREIQLVTEIQG